MGVEGVFHFTFAVSLSLNIITNASTNSCFEVISQFSSRFQHDIRVKSTNILHAMDNFPTLCRRHLPEPSQVCWEQQHVSFMLAYVLTPDCILTLSLGQFQEYFLHAATCMILICHCCCFCLNQESTLLFLSWIHPSKLM